jgi:hypothetical protein
MWPSSQSRRRYQRIMYTREVFVNKTHSSVVPEFMLVVLQPARPAQSVAARGDTAPNLRRRACGGASFCGQQRAFRHERPCTLRAQRLRHPLDPKQLMQRKRAKGSSCEEGRQTRPAFRVWLAHDRKLVLFLSIGCWAIIPARITFASIRPALRQSPPWPKEGLFRRKYRFYQRKIGHTVVSGVP